MKRTYFPGFQLAALHTLPTTLLICLVAALLQLGYTYWQLQSASVAFRDITDGQMGSIFRVCLLAVASFSLRPCRTKSNYSYFLRRLRLPSSHLGFLWSANTLCSLVLFWGSQVVIFWGCNALAQSMMSPDTWSHQTFLIDCYRSNVLHSVLPMGDGIVWVRNLLSLVAIALASGFTVVTAWQGGQGKLSIFTIVIVALSCTSSGSAVDLLLIGLYAVIILVTAMGILGAEEDSQ